jgi:hypothetical protein
MLRQVRHGSNDDISLAVTKLLNPAEAFHQRVSEGEGGYDHQAEWPDIPNFKNILMLSWAIFVIFFSFYASVNVYSKLLKENGHESLGF